FGRDFRSPSERAQRRFQFIDNFSLPAGRHNLKFGADFSRYDIDTVSPIFLGGIIDFAQLPIPLGQVLGAGAASQLVTDLTRLGRADLATGGTGPPLPRA